MVELEGKRVLVVGATSGMGRATAAMALRERMEVVIAGSRLDRARRTAEAIGGGTPVEIDLSDPGSIAGAAEAVGAIDHLVVTAQSPAAVATIAPLAALDFEALRRVFEVKFFGSLALVRAFAPHLARDGSIVLMSGAASRRAIPGYVALGALNGAVEAAGRQLARDLAPVRVNVVSPGLVRTEAFDGVPEDVREAMFRRSAEALPVGRVGRPEDIALAVLGLLANGYVTGTVHDVDGGSLIV